MATSAYNISTQTYVIYLFEEIKLNLAELYDNLQLSSSIIQAKFKNKCKNLSTTDGVVTVTDNIVPLYSKNFLKCITFVIIQDDDKKLGIKLFNNGSMQITGCKCEEHVKACINIIYTQVLSPHQKIKYYLVPVMMNINFSLQYNIDRNKLAQYLYEKCKINIPPFTTSTGLKFKLVDKNELQYDLLEFNPDTLEHTFLEKIDYFNFYADNSKKLNKIYTPSVSIFRDGRILISGIDRVSMENKQKWLIAVLDDCRELIEIKRDETADIKTFL